MINFPHLEHLIMSIRVLHLINQLGYGGGAERQLLLNLKHFDRNVKSLVCQVYPEGIEYSDKQAADELRGHGITVVSLDFRGITGWVTGLFRLIKLVKSENIDVIHSSLLLADFLGLLAGWITRIPVVVTLVNSTYGPEWVQDNPSLTKWKHRLFSRGYRLLISSVCSHAVAISGAVKDNAIQHLGLAAEKVTVVYRSLPPQWHTQSETTDSVSMAGNLRSNLRLDGSYPVLLNVARVVPNKGQVYLLEAIAQLKDEFPKIKLLIAGEITQQIDLAKIRDDLNLQQNVSLLGYRSDVITLHQISDIGVFSSIYEGFANALAEALASGLPCVITDIGPWVEMSNNGEVAVMVPTRSPEALAEGIRYLCRNPDAAADLGKRAQQHVFKNFTVTKAVTAYTEIFSMVTKTKAKGVSGQRLVSKPK